MPMLPIPYRSLELATIGQGWHDASPSLVTSGLARSLGSALRGMLSSGTLLHYHMRVDDRQREILLRIDAHPVHGRQGPCTPGGEQGTILLEHNQEMRTTIE